MKPRIDMHRLQELVRLHRLETRPVEVARLLRMSRKTERAYRLALDAEGLLAGDPAELPSQDALREAVERRHPAKQPRHETSSAERWRAEIETQLRRGARYRAIYDHLCRKHGSEFRASYHAVRRLARRIERAQGIRPEDVAIPRVTRPGLEAQVDFGYAGQIPHPETGELRKVWAFVMTLSHSRHMAVRYCFDQSQETWIRVHVECLEEFGGVVEQIVPDNLKAAVIKRAFGSEGDTTLTRSYRELARHYGFKVDPTPVRTPEHKGGVESGVKYLRNNLLKTRDLEGSSLAVEERELARWVAETAGRRTHGTTRRQPREAFETEERGALQPLPAEPFELKCWSRLKVHQDAHVHCGRAYYSVPFRYLGQQADACETAQSVTIYVEGRRVATHARVAPGRFSTYEEHLPEGRAPYRHRDPASWRERAGRIGPQCARYVEEVLGQDAVLSYLHHAQRAVLCLEGVEAHRAEAACERALHFGNLKPKALEEILSQGLECKPLTTKDVEIEARSAAAPRPRYARDPAEILAGAGAA